MSLLLALRSLLQRPRRTAMLLGGYAVGVAVMIVLLSVGEAVLRQARDVDLIGGGDLVLLPQGIDPEVIKSGGATGMYFRIPQGRYLLRQVLAGYGQDVAVASPQLLNRVLYVKARSGIRRVLSSGVFPEQEKNLGANLPASWVNSAPDKEWMQPGPDRLYSELDHFHPDTSRNPSWGEWHYFNFVDPLQDVYGYISFLTAGEIFQGRGMGVVSLQLKRKGNPVEHYKLFVTGSQVEISGRTPDLRIGACRVEFKDSSYRINLSLPNARGELLLHPTPGMYAPAIEVSRPGFRSGYVVPALSGKISGELSSSRGTIHLNNALGYHDHNWGTWAGVHWDWGQASDGITALVYGAVKAPGLGARTGGYFCVVVDTSGFIGLLRPDTVLYEGWKNENGVLIPKRIWFTKRNTNADSLSVRMVVKEAIATDLGRLSRSSGGRGFLQMRGTYIVKGRLSGREISFSAPGAAETFSSNERSNE